MVAPSHQCARGEEIATLKTTVSNIVATIQEHHATLYGNARPGLEGRTTIAEGKIMDHGLTLADFKDAATEVRKAKRDLLYTFVGTIVATILATALITILTMLLGCTSVKYLETRPDGTEVKASYQYLLQDKSQKVIYDPTNGTFSVEAENSSDPAVEAFKEGLAAGAGKAVLP